MVLTLFFSLWCWEFNSGLCICLASTLQLCRVPTQLILNFYLWQPVCFLRHLFLCLILMILDLQWFDLGFYFFLNFMVVRKWYTFSRNLVEFWSFSGLDKIISHDTGQWEWASATSQQEDWHSTVYWSLGLLYYMYFY